MMPAVSSSMSEATRAGSSMPWSSDLTGTGFKAAEGGGGRVGAVGGVRDEDFMALGTPAADARHER